MCFHNCFCLLLDVVDCFCCFLMVVLDGFVVGCRSWLLLGPIGGVVAVSKIFSRCFTWFCLGCFFCLTKRHFWNYVLFF